jgi:hypothetical protein
VQQCHLNHLISIILGCCSFKEDAAGIVADKVNILNRVPEGVTTIKVEGQLSSILCERDIMKGHTFCTLDVEYTLATTTVLLRRTYYVLGELCLQGKGRASSKQIVGALLNPPAFWQAQV